METPNTPRRNGPAKDGRVHPFAKAFFELTREDGAVKDQGDAVSFADLETAQKIKSSRSSQMW